MVSAAALWLFIFMPGLGLLDHYLAKLFGPMNNNWLGAATALLALALIGVEVRRLLHASSPAAEHSGLDAGSGAEGANTQVFKVTLPLLRPTLSFGSPPR